jgi:hypothetical protein
MAKEVRWPMDLIPSLIDKLYPQITLIEGKMAKQ